jgi:hypothetical protein
LLVSELKRRHLKVDKKVPDFAGTRAVQWLIGASQLGQLQIDDQRTGK